MPFLHKYQQHDFRNGFATHNSILDTVPYLPEVIFIGTHNHGWTWNQSDFFYGRGMYMWPSLANLFLYNQNLLVSQRTRNNNEPTLQQIFEICKIGKIVFADIVKGIKDEILAIEIPEQRCVLVNNEYEWRSREVNGLNIGEYSDTHLDLMGSSGWLDDNVDAIVNYINNTQSITDIYFTFKSGQWLVDKLNGICNNIRENVSFCSIFTPTANGFGNQLLPPYHQRLWGLTHCWVWNGLVHNHPIARPNYGHLRHEWLIDKGANPNIF